jgi:hypothetical protein
MRLALTLTLAIVFMPGVVAQGVSPAEDAERIEELVRLRAETLRSNAAQPTVALNVLPPPVAEIPEASRGVAPGPVSFEQLPLLQGRWLAIRTRSGSLRRGQLVSIKGSEVMIRIGVGSQGATLPLNRKSIKSMELLP